MLTWLDRAHRDVLVVHPRDDLRNPEKGVFSTRSQDRPNPIGLHRVRVAAIEGPSSTSRPSSRAAAERQVESISYARIR